MPNQPLTNLKGILLISTSLALTACGGSGSNDTSTPVFRSAQNIVYLDDITNQSLMTAFDDGSASPFSLLDVNGGSIARNSIKLSPTTSLLPPGYSAEKFAFSSDSQHLATVYRKQSGTTMYQLYIAASGAGLDVLKAESIQNPMSINWANQSPSLAYTATDLTGAGHLYLLNMDNEKTTLLSTSTQSGERVEDFDWSLRMITWGLPVRMVCIW